MPAGLDAHQALNPTGPALPWPACPPACLPPACPPACLPAPVRFGLVATPTAGASSLGVSWWNIRMYGAGGAVGT